MAGKTQELYELVIDRIYSCFPEEGSPASRVSLMVSDYELAVIRALRSRFVNGGARECYFHYGQVRIFNTSFSTVIISFFIRLLSVQLGVWG